MNSQKLMRGLLFLFRKRSRFDNADDKLSPPQDMDDRKSPSIHVSFFSIGS